MAFRSLEAAEKNNDNALNYLVPRIFSDEEREAAKNKVLDMIDECGPAVDGYPLWHPLVSNQPSRDSFTVPNADTGYDGLDHTILFANGFVTCPYADGQRVIDAVENLPPHKNADITAERLGTPLYYTGTDPILVRCSWHEPLDNEGLVPKRIAVPLMIENTLPMWRWATRAERWETMRPYLLGKPHGSRSSLFVSQETALAMKKVHNAMNDSGMFGPLKMD